MSSMNFRVLAKLLQLLTQREKDREGEITQKNQIRIQLWRQLFTLISEDRHKFSPAPSGRRRAEAADLEAANTHRKLPLSPHTHTRTHQYRLHRQYLEISMKKCASNFTWKSISFGVWTLVFRNKWKEKAETETQWWCRWWGTRGNFLAVGPGAMTWTHLDEQRPSDDWSQFPLSPAPVVVSVPTGQEQGKGTTNWRH